MDLSNDKNFLSFVTNGEIDPNKKSGGKELEDYLKSKLEAAYPKKYARHFKAFYFAEHGYHPNGGNLSGYSSHGADYVVVFKSRNNQTAAHEFLHSMNLAHTFTNKEAFAHALYTYEYAKTDNLMDYSHHQGNDHKRCSLFYWQWENSQFFNTITAYNEKINIIHLARTIISTMQFSKNKYNDSNSR
ncbi:Uncharacterised protein [Bergeyella zoohelcum]|uniref:Uncharacterized protein n=1 Tax=Bergeyella zoohelcum TaxID=1015 RepID=A0A376C0J6_9FLAO|nr:Uncharacterised protein [Bergeyella zoohelcum]